MTDKELLELAAEAAGLDGVFIGDVFNIIHGGEYAVAIWNPLTDDGDALRLAVKLGMQITQYPVERGVTTTCWERGGDVVHVDQNYGRDGPEAATRHAIVRAAAEIGRNMK